MSVKSLGVIFVTLFAKMRYTRRYGQLAMPQNCGKPLQALGWVIKPLLFQVKQFSAEKESHVVV